MSAKTSTVLSDRIWPGLRWDTWDTADSLFVANPRARIFLVSYALLFFELLCIRWIPAYLY
jgi:hypothetical protein